MKKLPLILLSFIILFLIPVSGPAQSSDPVYIIPVEGEIEKGLIWVIERGVEEAEAAGAQAIVLHMNTNGGSAAATQEIMELLTGPISSPTPSSISGPSPPGPISPWPPTISTWRPDR